MPIPLFCPVCHVKVEVPDRLAGKSAPCPSCGNVVDIPNAERPGTPSRATRRLKAIAVPAAAALAMLASVLAWFRSTETQKAVSDLQTEIRILRENASAPERLAPAPPPPAPTPAPAPPTASADGQAAIRREIADLREAHEALQQRMQELESDLASAMKPLPAAPSIPAAPPPPELASDEDITMDIKGQLDATSPRPRFLFVGTVANAGLRNAPVVQIVIRVTGFQGLDPVNRQLVTSVSYAASLTERIRSLPPGTRAHVVKDLIPSDPALFTRDVIWEPQFEAGAKVLRD